jgi:IclR family acetate operon transcriptional repressor
VSTVKEVQSVRNACVIIEAISAQQPVGVSELARRTGIDKSAAQRITVTLHRAGWLHRTGEGRWQIAPALRLLVDCSGAGTLVSMFRPVIERLRDDTGETAMLVAIEDGRLIVLDVAESRHNLRITAPVGSELPLPHSSAARAIGAHLPPDDLAALRILDPSLDAGVLAEIRRRGWAINDREIVPDARVVGSAVLSSAAYPLAAVIVCAPTSRIDLEHMSRIGDLVAHAARAAVPEGIQRA